MRLSRPLVAAFLAFIGGAAQAAPLDPAVLEVEQQACRQAARGQVEEPGRACRCMVAGLVELTQEQYEALSGLVNAGIASPEGTAAREAVREAIEQCLGG